MLHLKEELRANHQRFVQRVAASEMAWGLKGPGGYAECSSNEHQSRYVLMFWSDRAYATRAQRGYFPDHVPHEIALFDLLFRWLPGMGEDGVYAGTNYTGDLAGLEIHPLDLQEELLAALPRDRVAAHLDHLKFLTNQDRT